MQISFGKKCRKKWRLSFLAFMLFASLPADAENLNGKWTYQRTTPTGVKRTVDLNLKVEGSALKGTVSTSGGELPISEGKVDGKNIQFSVKRNVNGHTSVDQVKGVLNENKLDLTIVPQNREAIRVMAHRPCPPDCE
jgi:hypothetical protein